MNVNGHKVIIDDEGRTAEVCFCGTWLIVDLPEDFHFWDRVVAAYAELERSKTVLAALPDPGVLGIDIAERG